MRAALSCPAPRWPPTGADAAAWRCGGGGGAAADATGKHVVFGKVSAGMDVLKAMEAVGSKNSGKTSKEVPFARPALLARDCSKTARLARSSTGVRHVPACGAAPHARPLGPSCATAATPERHQPLTKGAVARVSACPVASHTPPFSMRRCSSKTAARPVPCGGQTCAKNKVDFIFGHLFKTKSKIGTAARDKALLPTSMKGRPVKTKARPSTRRN